MVCKCKALGKTGLWDGDDNSHATVKKLTSSMKWLVTSRVLEHPTWHLQKLMEDNNNKKCIKSQRVKSRFKILIWTLRPGEQDASCNIEDTLVSIMGPWINQQRKRTCYHCFITRCQPWQSWNSLCRPDWLWIHRDCFCLPSAGIKKCTEPTMPGLNWLKISTSWVW